ncbi:MAG: mechanosensitive ion channel family protein [Synergistes sp.]|nr:mechanosensitive ion channel family protein [Synergistes sp.]
MINKVITLLFVSLLVISSPTVLYAESSLEQLNETIASYQTNLIKRAIEVRDELKRVNEVETALSKQYNMPLSEILRYETTLSYLDGVYTSHHYLLATMNNDNSDLYDDEKLANLIQVKPPYTFEYYFDLIQHFNYYKGWLENIGSMIADANRYAGELAVAKNSLEEEYRKLLERYDNSPTDRVKYKLKIIICQSQLERCYAEAQYLDAQVNAHSSLVSSIKDKITAIDPIIKNVREIMGKTEIDYAVFDNIVAKSIAEIDREIDKLNVRYRELSQTESSHAQTRKFQRYCTATEKKHIKTEILSLIEMKDLWMGVRMMLRNIGDILHNDSEHIGMADREAAAEFIKNMSERCKQGERYLRTQLDEVRQTYQDVNDVNNGNLWVVTPEDVAVRNRLYSEMSERIARYGHIIIMYNGVNEYIDILSNEIQKENDMANADRQTGALLRDDFVSILDREVWHIDDYPITVLKIIQACLVFVGVFVITRIITFFLRKRFRQNHVRNNVARLVVYLIFLIGMLIAFLIVLWVLHIPLTAFAFVGGAVAIAVGFGAQKTIGDILSGVLLLIQNNLRVGDSISIDGKAGVIQEISLFNTIMRCNESEILIIPNSRVIDAPILNSTLNNYIVREQIRIEISDENNIDRAREIICSVLQESSYVLKKPTYRVLLSEYKNGTAEFLIHVFIDTEHSIRDAITCSIRLEIINKLLENGIAAARPCADITLFDGNAKENK